MNRKVRDILFLLICVTLIFNLIPRPIQMGFLGGPVGSKLIFYPLAAAFLYSFWCEWKYRNVFVDFKLFIRYIFVYLAVTLLSTAVGLYVYPYYDLVLNGPADQIEKLPAVLAFCAAHGIPMDAKPLMQAWIVARQLKSVVMEAFWCFGASYLIYCWYREEWKRALKLIGIGILATTVILFVYNTIELLYLAGNKTAKHILEVITPYIHTVKTNHGWWPPLLWKNQLRMVFPEPSHVGNYIAYFLPMLWYKLFVQHTKAETGAVLAITGLMSFWVFATNARTAYAMLFGILGLLLLLLIWGRQYDALKKYALILSCVGIGFFGYVQFSGVHYSEALANNFWSLTAMTGQAPKANASAQKKPAAVNHQGSNISRLALIKANLRTFAEHPVLGVGNGLQSAYTEAHFTPAESKHREVANWIKYQKKYGPMAAGKAIPNAMNEFVARLSETGIVGLATFLFPFGVVVWKLLKKQRKERNFAACFMLLGVIAALVAGCNGSVRLVFGEWILLGVAFAVAFGRPGNERLSDE